jgi:hypothetical protein
MSKTIERAPAQPVRHPDGRLRGLLLTPGDWARLGVQPGERVIVELVTPYQARLLAFGADPNNIDIAPGEVAIEEGQPLVRCASIEPSDLREHALFVRRPR